MSYIAFVRLFPQVLTDVLIPATMQEMPERFGLSPDFTCNSFHNVQSYWNIIGSQVPKFLGVSLCDTFSNKAQLCRSDVGQLLQKL